MHFGCVQSFLYILQDWSVVSPGWCRQPDILTSREKAFLKKKHIYNGSNWSNSEINQILMYISTYKRASRMHFEYQLYNINFASQTKEVEFTNQKCCSNPKSSSTWDCLCRCILVKQNKTWIEKQMKKKKKNIDNTKDTS